MKHINICHYLLIYQKMTKQKSYILNSPGTNGYSMEDLTKDVQISCQQMFDELNLKEKSIFKKTILTTQGFGQFSRPKTQKKKENSFVLTDPMAQILSNFRTVLRTLQDCFQRRKIGITAFKSTANGKNGKCKYHVIYKRQFKD